MLIVNQNSDFFTNFPGTDLFVKSAILPKNVFNNDIVFDTIKSKTYSSFRTLFNMQLKVQWIVKCMFFLISTYSLRNFNTSPIIKPTDVLFSCKVTFAE